MLSVPPQQRHGSAWIPPPPNMWYSLLEEAAHIRSDPAAPLHHKYKRELPLSARVTTQWVPLSPASWLRPGQPRSCPDPSASDGGGRRAGIGAGGAL